MDFANRGNSKQPAQNNNQQNNAPQQQQQGGQNFNFAQQGSNNQPAPKKQKRSVDFTKIGTFVLLVLTALILFGVISMLAFGQNGSSESDLIKTDQYQAVFLDSADGQVYFGKLEVESRSLYRLTDIYYVRVQQGIQPNTDGQTQANISLAKLGNELHGPEDEMFINKDKVLFWENLKTDGQVTEAIKEYVENGGEATQQDNNAQQQTQTEQQPAAQQQNEEQTDNTDANADTTNTDDAAN